MNCEQAETLLPQYVFEELADEQQADVQAHVDACPSCRRAVGDLRVSLKLLREQIITEPAPVLSDAAKAALLAHVSSGAETETAAPPPKPVGRIRRLARRMSVRSGIAAAAACVLLGVGLWAIITEYYPVAYIDTIGGWSDESQLPATKRVVIKNPAKSGKYYREAGGTGEIKREGLYRAIGEIQYDEWGVNEERAGNLAAGDALAPAELLLQDSGSFSRTAEKEADTKSRWEKSIEAIGSEKTNVLTDYRWLIQTDERRNGEPIGGEANTASRSDPADCTRAGSACRRSSVRRCSPARICCRPHRSPASRWRPRCPTD